MHGRRYTNKGDTREDNDVWLGYGATVMPEVTIGDGVSVAAQAVVTREVPLYAIVGDSPAGLIRKRFFDTDVDRLPALRRCQ